MNNADMPASPILGDETGFLSFLSEGKPGRNYGLTKREHAVIEYIKGMLSNPAVYDMPFDDMIIQAKLAANKTFKALEDTE